MIESPLDLSRRLAALRTSLAGTEPASASSWSPDMLPDLLITDEELAEAVSGGATAWADTPDWDAVFPAGLPSAPDTSLDYGDTTFELLAERDVPEWLATPVLGAELLDAVPLAPPVDAEATQMLGLLDESAVTA